MARPVAQIQCRLPKFAQVDVQIVVGQHGQEMVQSSVKGHHRILHPDIRSAQMMIVFPWHSTISALSQFLYYDDVRRVPETWDRHVDMLAVAQFVSRRNARTKLQFGADRLQGNPERIVNFNCQIAIGVVVRIVPQGDTIGPYWLGLMREWSSAVP